jgi:hypothetical protein
MMFVVFGLTLVLGGCRGKHHPKTPPAASRPSSSPTQPGGR